MATRAKIAQLNEKEKPPQAEKKKLLKILPQREYFRMRYFRFKCRDAERYYLKRSFQLNSDILLN
jgi:hypothetical protein